VTQSYQVNVPMLLEADGEARSLGHQWVGPEHLLLAVASHPDELTLAFFDRNGLPANALRETIAELVGPPPEEPSAADVPLTLILRSQVAIAAAIREGKRRGIPGEVYTQFDLLNALFSDEVAGSGMISEMLQRFGMSPVSARVQLALLEGPTA
jgi:ATP-dependent Clp protease ATP-binding subunit ClpA